MPRFIDWAENRIGKVAQATERKSYVHVAKLALPFVQEVRRRHDLHTEITGVPTGYPDIDRMTGGLQPGDFIVLSARPSNGKTTWALNCLINAAKEGYPGLLFSLEMGKDAIIEKIHAIEGHLDGLRMRSGALSAQEFGSLTQAMVRISDLPLWVDDTNETTALEIRAKARRWRSDPTIFPPTEEGKPPKLGIIVVDYLQMVAGSDDSQNREREVAGIGKALKGLAKELRLPVIAISPLKRARDRRERSERPNPEMLRESGSLEYDADDILFLHRPVLRKDDPPDRANITEFIIGKQRNGPTGIKELVYRKECNRFESVTHREPDQMTMGGL